MTPAPRTTPFTPVFRRAVAAAAVGALTGVCAAQEGSFVGPPAPVVEKAAPLPEFDYLNPSAIAPVVPARAPTLLPALAAAPAAPEAPAVATPPVEDRKPAPTLEKPRPLGTPREPKDAAGVADGMGGGPGVLAGGLTRTGLSLALVLGLIFVLAVLAKKLAGKKLGLAAAFGPAGPSPAGLLEILGRYPVGRGQSLVLLKMDRRVLLLSQSSSLRLRGGGSSLSTLCEVTDPDDVASILTKSQDAEQESVAARFRTLLSRFDARHEAGPAEDGYTHLRSVRTTDEGDRAELWDDRPDPGRTLPFPETAVVRREPALTPAAAPVPVDGATALRQRLEAMRMGGVR